LVLTWGVAQTALNLETEEIVQASGSDITVTGYSVPSCVDWNDDQLLDLIVGEGGGGFLYGYVRIYLNTGTAEAPSFTDFFHAQSGGSNLSEPASGCLGLVPRVVYWDGDGRKDLLVGRADGLVRIYLNVGSEAEPEFDAGTTLLVGLPGGKTDIDVGSRATPVLVDWDGDGRRDLVVGAIDGRFHLYLNEGTDTAPDYLMESFVQESGVDLVVPSLRCSPVVADCDDDGKKDILTGNTNGELLLYANIGSDIEPDFAGYEMVEANGVPIDLDSFPRSRPYLCDWTGDGHPDVLIGAGDGRVHLYRGLGTTPVLADHRTVCRLLAPWPNPCNPRATIAFSLEQLSPVQVAIYDLAGRRVDVLAERTFAAGKHVLTWRGEDGRGHPLPTGLYLVRLATGRYVSTRKLLLQR
jgi:hypothetical protein